jgi:hypothetical protein
MVTMVDEIYDRHYQAGRDRLNGAILLGAKRFGRALEDAFASLNRIEYDAPWTPRAKQVR